MDWLNSLDPHWTWLAIGLLLAAAEIAVPGFFLIWLAAAAVMTGLVAWVMPVPFALQVLLFAVLSIGLVPAARRWLRTNEIESADPAMNDRGARLMGETVLVTHAIDGGTGRVRHGDSEWLARGPDAAPGTRMRISGHDGAVLIVEHLH
ncbi:NfeD family protein [Novosphingobium sp. MW5]|nr:NfeD family protein [Novosphingobium sp. MW5]